MINKTLALTLLTTSITACGGGGSSADGGTPDAQQGILAGLVGVKYTTETQSGVIGTAGEFQYLVDESLTLSIGNTALGQLPAAANVSLSGLFTDLPDTAKSIRTALRMPEYTRMGIKTTHGARVTQGSYNALHKASNLMQLLLALDNNHDASDGIDITGNTAAVSDLSINFDASLFEFANSTPLKVFQHTSNISLGMEVSKPLSEVYKLMDITLSAPRRTAHVGADNRDQTYTYNSLGQLTQQEEQQSSDSISRYSYSYDETSALQLSKEYTSEPFGDTSREAYKENTIYSYNNFGLQKTKTKEIFVYGDTSTVESRRLTSKSYLDNKVFIAINRNQEDDNADGTSNYSASIRNEYNDSWKITVDKTYSAATPEEEIFEYGSTYSYSDDGTLKESLYENTNSNSANQTIYSEIKTAQKIERSLKSISSRVGDEDTKKNITEVFSINGQLLSKQTRYLDANDNITRETNITYGYDTNGRVDSCQYDQGSQGTSITKRNFTYSDAGLESYITSNYSDGEDTAYSVETNSMSYGNNGEILTDKDGNTYRYGEPVANAISYLVNEYMIDWGYAEYDRTMRVLFYAQGDKCSP